MGDEFDPKLFERRVKSQLKVSGESFRGKYRDELDQLAGLSRQEIDQIAPGITDLQKYDELITIVKEASRINLSQAQLKTAIEKLGGITVSIAKKIPGLAAIL
jgi:hypothetical protein